VKLLIIRFSSIGDVTQCLSIVSHIRRFHPQAEIHFLTRFDMEDIFKSVASVQKVWGIPRGLSFFELLRFCWSLRSEKFTHIYDAHNNLRSRLARTVITKDFLLINRIDRWKRFLLLQFHINKFEKPLSGQRELLNPLRKWDLPFQFPNDLPTTSLFQIESSRQNQVREKFNLPAQFVALVPTAAYELKRWPIGHWSELIRKNPDLHFVVLAGPLDTFTSELSVHKNVSNLTAKTTLQESLICLSLADVTIANDTGLMHISEQLARPTIALMGPAPFGYPSRPSTKILELDLSCRPCSKHGQGPCTNPDFQACLKNIEPTLVSQVLHTCLNGNVRK